MGAPGVRRATGEVAGGADRSARAAGPTAHGEGTSWRFGVPVLLISLAMRIAAVLGMRVYRYFDSAEYDIVDFSGRSRRPPTTPLLYSLLPDAQWGTVIGQAVLGALCWAALAIVLATWFGHPKIRVGVAATVIALSLTTGVTNWDTTRLSEPTSISLTVLLIAVWVMALRSTTWTSAGLVLAVTVPWLFVRQSVMPTAWATVALTGFLLISVARRPNAESRDRNAALSSMAGRPVRPLALLLVGLVIACAAATVHYSRNTEIAETNLTTVISSRIGPDAERLQWFTDAGMPLPPGGATDFGSLDRDPAFREWRHEDGTRTYARFLATHPWFALTGPMPELFSERPSYQEMPPLADEPRIPTPAMLSPGEGYGSSRQVMPAPLEQILFAPGDTGAVIFGAAVIMAWALYEAMIDPRRRGDRRMRFAWSLLGLSLLSLWTTWHGSINELARLSVVPALTLRIAAIIIVGVLAERAVGRVACSEGGEAHLPYPRRG